MVPSVLTIGIQERRGFMQPAIVKVGPERLRAI